MKAVIFDMDGVIFDSERATYLCWKKVAEEHGLERMDEVYRKCIGVTVEVTRQICLDAYGEDFPYEQFAKEASVLYHERYDGGRLPVKEGTREILSYLKENGIPTAIASSTRQERVVSQLDEAGLLGFFNAVVGGESVSKSKPAPDIFLFAAKKLGIAPADCVVIEDSFNGIRAAHAAGMIPVMVPDMLEPDDEIRGKCKFVCISLREVLSLMLENAL
ncbi:MAG: HAD family phosphatase [Lachnospiraceae bacterium]|nr:HAD family phosphatase [Lachnospiraceae bacterium]